MFKCTHGSTDIGTQPRNVTNEEPGKVLCLVAKNGFRPGEQGKGMYTMSVKSTHVTTSPFASMGVARPPLVKATSGLRWPVHGADVPHNSGCALQVDRRSHHEQHNSPLNHRQAQTSVRNPRLA